MLDLDDKTHIKYYKSLNLFVIYKNSIIDEIIYTSTCWSDDFIIFKIKDLKVISYYERYHGCRSLIINYDENEVVKSFEYNNGSFGIPPIIGDKSYINVSEFISKIVS